MEHFVFQHPY